MTQTSDSAEVLHQLALTEFRSGNAAKALDLIDQAIALNPSDAAFHNNRGYVLEKLKRLDEALESLNHALAIRPRYGHALNNRGNVLNGLKRHEEAILSFDSALALNSGHAEALNNKGNALQHLGRLSEALASYDQALAIRPDYAQAFNNRGLVLAKLNRLEEALKSYDRALSARSDYAEAHANRGDVLYDMKRFDEALESYNCALAIRPDHPFLFGRRVFCKKRICDWRDEEADFDRLSAIIDRGEKATPLFAALASPLSAAQLRMCSERYVKDIHPRSGALPPLVRGYGHDRIRLGYFSADFWNHPVA